MNKVRTMAALAFAAVLGACAAPQRQVMVDVSDVKDEGWKGACAPQLPEQKMICTFSHEATDARVLILRASERNPFEAARNFYAFRQKGGYAVSDFSGLDSRNDAVRFQARYENPESGKPRSQEITAKWLPDTKRVLLFIAAWPTGDDAARATANQFADRVDVFPSESMTSPL